MFEIKHSCHIHCKKSLLKPFSADKFGNNWSGCISDHLKIVALNLSAPPQELQPLKPHRFGNLIPPPTLRKKSTPLAASILKFKRISEFTENVCLIITDIVCCNNQQCNIPRTQTEIQISINSPELTGALQTATMIVIIFSCQHPC